MRLQIRMLDDDRCPIVRVPLVELELGDPLQQTHKSLRPRGRPLIESNRAPIQSLEPESNRIKQCPQELGVDNLPGRPKQRTPTNGTEMTIRRRNHVLEAVGTENVVAGKDTDALVPFGVDFPTEGAVAVVVCIIRVGWDDSCCEERRL